MFESSSDLTVKLNNRTALLLNRSHSMGISLVTINGPVSVDTFGAVNSSNRFTEVVIQNRDHCKKQFRVLEVSSSAKTTEGQVDCPKLIFFDIEGRILFSIIVVTSESYGIFHDIEARGIYIIKEFEREEPLIRILNRVVFNFNLPHNSVERKESVGIELLELVGWKKPES